MANRVLRNGVFMGSYSGQNRLCLQAKDGREFSMRLINERRGGQHGGGRVRRTAKKAREQEMVLRRPVWKKGRVPDGAEDAKARRARDEETESVERVAHISAPVAEGHDSNRDVFELSENRRGSRMESFYQRGRNIGGSR